MSEHLLDYKYDRWVGDNDEFFVSLSDATLRKHLNAYLEVQGICTLSYLELQAVVRQIHEQQFQALQYFRQLDYWLTCDDPDVAIRACTVAAHKRLKERN